MTRRCKVLGLLSLALVVLLAPARAWGFWVVGSSGATGVSVANALGAPILSVTSYTNTSVTLAVAAPASGLLSTSYQINQAGYSTASNVCPPISSSGGTCTVSSLSTGHAYTYQAVGTYSTSSWTVASATVNVTPNDIFLVKPANGTKTAGTLFNVTITATTDGSTPDPGYASVSKSLSWSGNDNSPDGTKTPVYPGNPVSFNANSKASVSVTLFNAEQSVLTVTDSSGITGTSAAFNVNAATAANLALTNVSGEGDKPTGTLCLYTCVVEKAGAAGNTVNAKILLTDSYGNPVNAGAAMTVGLTTTGGTLSGTSVNIVVGNSKSAQFTLTTQTGTGWTSEILTAAASTGCGSSFTSSCNSATLTVYRQAAP